MTPWLHYLRHALRDRLWHSPMVRSLASRWLAFRAKRTGNLTQRLTGLARAAHLRPEGTGLANLHASLRETVDALPPEQIDWDTLGVKPSSNLPKAIVLKAPVSQREKGVLHIAFEQQWLRLLRSGRSTAIAERYDVVLGPSWSPPPEAAMLLMAKLWPGPVYSMISNRADVSRMHDMSDELVPVPLLASHWVNPKAFEPYLTDEREIDIVMLANFGEFKRHWLFFDALRRLPRDYRVLLLGVPLGGRTEADLRAEARAFGVEDRFELIVRPSREDIAKLLCRAKVSLIFSQREGSCVAVAESLFADVPVGLFADAHIGSKEFLHEQTGRLLTRRGLSEQLQRFVEESDTFRPRAWAVENISCYRSIEVLNRILRERAVSAGRPWTRDLVPFQMDMLFRYLSQETAEAMTPAVVDFAKRYGIRLGQSVVDEGQETPVRELARS